VIKTYKIIEKKFYFSIQKYIKKNIYIYIYILREKQIQMMKMRAIIELIILIQ